MKKIIFFTAVFLTLGLATPTLAAKENNPGQQNNQQIQAKKQSTIAPISTGGSQSLSPTATPAASLGKKPNPRSETAREHMSIVARKVEELLTLRTTKGGIGEQVRQIAQEQNQSQAETQTQLNNIASKSGVLKKLFGPDYRAIRNLNRVIEQNQLRIQQLEQLANQVENQADKTKIQETIQILIAQNTALQDLVNAEENAGSLFGWLVKLFSR